MTDLHLRILRLRAKERQRELDDHDGADHTGDAGWPSAGALERAAARTGATVAAAEPRRRTPRLTRRR